MHKTSTLRHSGLILIFFPPIKRHIRPFNQCLICKQIKPSRLEKGGGVVGSKICRFAQPDINIFIQIKIFISETVKNSAKHLTVRVIS